MARLIADSNPFRICFFIMWLIKGIANGVFGVYNVPGFPMLQSEWERQAGFLLGASSLVVIIGLTMPERTPQQIINSVFLRKWGYFSFAVSTFLLGTGSMFLDDGWLIGIVLLMFSGCALYDWRAEDGLVKGVTRYERR